MLPVLLEQDHRQQARPGKAARQHVERRRRLADLLAGPAGELLAHVLDHLPLPRHHLQRLGDVLAELGEPAEPQQGQAVGPGTITRSRGRCAGNGLRAGFLRVKARTASCRRCGRLLGRELVLGRRSFQLLELKLHLVEQTRLALAARRRTISRRSFSIVSCRCAINASALAASARACASASLRAAAAASASRHRRGENHRRSSRKMESQDARACDPVNRTMIHNAAISPPLAVARCAAAAASRSLPAGSRAAPA